MSIEVSCFKIWTTEFLFYNLPSSYQHRVSVLNLFWGGPQESHLTPLSTRTTNKELSAESFMTKMTQ